MEVQASDVIDVYKQKLAEAFHEIAILTAQVQQLQRQGALADERPAGRNEVHGSQTPE